MMRRLVFGSALLTILIASGSVEAKLLLPEGREDARTPAATGSCVPDAHTLCFLGGRFLAAMTYTLNPPTGQTKLGRAVQLSDTSGYFEYEELPGTVQVLVNVIDACNPLVGNHYWVFLAGLTDVNLLVGVQDTLAPNQPARAYVNPKGRAFLPVQDTSAFATCP